MKRTTSARGAKLDAIEHKPSGGTKRKKGKTTVSPIVDTRKGRYGLKVKRMF